MDLPLAPDTLYTLRLLKAEPPTVEASATRGGYVLNFEFDPSRVTPEVFGKRLAQMGAELDRALAG